MATLKYLRVLFGYFVISKGCHYHLQTHKQASKFRLQKLLQSFRLQRLLQAQAYTWPQQNIIICWGFEPLPIRALPIAKQMTYTQCDTNTCPLNKQIQHFSPLLTFNYSQVRHISLLLHTHITQQSQPTKTKKGRCSNMHGACTSMSKSTSKTQVST